MSNYIVSGKWIILNYIAKNVEVDDNEDKYVLESKLNEADTVVMKKRLLRKNIYAVNDTREETKDTFDRDDVYMLCSYDYGDIHVILTDEEVVSILDYVGPEK